MVYKFRLNMSMLDSTRSVNDVTVVKGSAGVAKYEQGERPGETHTKTDLLQQLQVLSS